MTKMIRIEYKKDDLKQEDLFSNPVQLFSKWFEEARTSNITEPNAMTLATASRAGAPTARMVLLKEFSEKGFIFFTNYESRKAQQLGDNPFAALVFWWEPLQRQIRIEGKVARISEQESDQYFSSRPRGSQIGAWVSKQSTVIDSKAILETRFLEYEQTFAGEKVRRPSYWGGYIVFPTLFEFWQGRPNRLHDRFQYSLRKNNTWAIDRLSP